MIDAPDEESRALYRLLEAELADEEQDMQKMELLLRAAIRQHGCRHSCLSPLINALAAQNKIGKAIELMGVAYGGRMLSSKNTSVKPLVFELPHFVFHMIKMCGTQKLWPPILRSFFPTQLTLQPNINHLQ